MKKVLVGFILLIVVSNLYSQFDYRSGFVILNSTDTLDGLIDFRSDYSNCQHIFFKTDSISEAIKYTPDQLIAYHFYNSKYYVSKHIELNNQGRNVFLEVLLFGEVSLFYGVIEDSQAKDKNSIRNEHFFVEKEGEIVEIENNLKTIINPNGNDFVKNSNQYKGILKIYFNDCPELFHKIEYLDFNPKALINITKDYHNKVCPGTECITFNKSFSKRKFSIGVEYNYIFPRIDFYSLDSKAITNGLPDSKYSFGFVGATNIDNDYRIWFQTILKYQYQSYSESAMYRDVYPTEYKYKYNSILIDLSAKYNIFLTKLKPYIIGGVKIGFITNQEYQFNSTINKIPAYAEDEKMFYGLKGGVGIEYDFSQKLSVYSSLDYNYYTTFSKMQITGFSLNTGISILL